MSSLCETVLVPCACRVALQAIVAAAKKLFSLRGITRNAEKKASPSQVPFCRAGIAKKAPMGNLAAGQQRDEALPGGIFSKYPELYKEFEECRKPCRRLGRA